MAKYQKKKIQDTENSGFGEYNEGVGGGGSPEPIDPNKHGHGVNSDYRQANNDTMQPRTSDGKFTYKSVNGQSIDPKYGPSRGKTVNPLLTGGENGIKISDVEQQFYNEKGALWDKFKDKWYQKGSEYALMSQGKHHKAGWTTRVAGDTIWNVGKRRYDKIKGEFTGESKVFSQGKKGARTGEEQQAIQKAQQTGEEQAVINQSSGAIKLKPGTPKVLPTPPAQPKAPSTQPSQPSSGGGQQPVVPTASLIHTKEQIDIARQFLTDNGRDVSGYTDEQLDQIIDDFVDFEDEDTNTSAAPTTPTDNGGNNNKIAEEPKEEESEAEKTIKKLGFTE